MNKLARNTLALGTATMIVTAAVSFSANGADATKSYSAGRFLTGSIGSTNLDSLAQLRGETAANPGNLGANKNNLDLTVLSTIPVNVPGGLNLDVAKLLSPAGSAGALSQYASAESTQKAVGASGAVSDSGAVLTTSGGVPINSKLSLKGGPLSGINDNLASVDLGVGALSSNTTVENGSPTTRAYQIGGLNLQLGVPLIGKLIGNVTNELTPVNAANNITLSPAALCSVSSSALTVSATTLLAQLNTLGVPTTVTSAVDTILNPLGVPTITSVNLCDPANPLSAVLNNATIGQLIAVKVTGLNDLTAGLKSFSGDGVAVDLNSGNITLDLAQILSAANIDINKLPPNTDLLKYLTTGLISDKITKVINSAITDVVAKLGAVDVEVSVAGTTLPLKLKDLTGQALPPLVNALTQASTAITQLGTPIDAVLADLVPNLNRLVQLTANNQSTSKTPTLGTGTVNAGSTKGSISTAAVGDYYRTSALKINVLSNTLNIDIAASEAATLPVAVVSDQVAAADDSDAPADNGDGSDSVSDGADANADNGDDSDTVADADAQADADVTTALPSTGAPNLLPFWLLGIALLLFGGAVLLNEKRRLNQV